MAKFSFEDYNAAQEARSTPRPTTKSLVSYFGLADDGCEAIVRFDYTSKNEVEIHSIHAVEAGGKNRKVECLRTPMDPVDMCPLCQAGYKVFQKMYVRLVEYVKQEDGTYKPEPRIWERPANFSRTLRSLIEDYGDLRDCIFKIKRQGKRGEQGTTYMVNFQNPRQYPEEIYKKDFSGFENYSLNRFVVLNKSPEDMVKFIETGDFPAPAPKEIVAEAIPTSAPEVQASVAEPKPQTFGVEHTPTVHQQPEQTPSFDSSKPRRYTY